MHKTQSQASSAPSASHRSTVILLLATMADTTWRLFVPTIGGTVLGLIADTQFSTKPWLTASGVIAGTIVAFSLLYLQLKRVNRENKP